LRSLSPGANSQERARNGSSLAVIAAPSSSLIGRRPG
jgi:hypothetical protein